MSGIQAVIGFWFAPEHRRFWFERSDAFDRAVRDRLAGSYERAAAGACEDWRELARGCLSLCILLDQVPRNLFRGDPRAFATDAAALAVARHALDQGFDRGLGQAERLFLFLPLEHSEDLADQELCCRLTALLDEAPEWHDYALRHRDIVARFGRFPHRNAVLGRVSTTEETAFLEQPGSSF